MPETAFCHLLEQRAARVETAGPTPISTHPGARVAAYLLREWEQYQLAHRLTPDGPGRRQSGRAGAPRRRSSVRSGSRERAAQVALLQRLGVSVPERRRAVKRRSTTPPPAVPDVGD
jgi:hypothetical protein